MFSQLASCTRARSCLHIPQSSRCDQAWARPARVCLALGMHRDSRRCAANQTHLTWPSSGEPPFQQERPPTGTLKGSYCLKDRCSRPISFCASLGRHKRQRGGATAAAGRVVRVASDRGSDGPWCSLPELQRAHEWAVKPSSSLPQQRKQQMGGVAVAVAASCPSSRSSRYSNLHEPAMQRCSGDYKGVGTAVPLSGS